MINIKMIITLMLISGCVSTENKKPKDIGEITVTLNSNILHISYGENNHWYQDISIIDESEVNSRFKNKFKDGNEISLTCNATGRYPYHNIKKQRYCHIEKADYSRSYTTYVRVKSIWLKRNDEQIRTAEGVELSSNKKPYLDKINRELYPEIYIKQNEYREESKRKRIASTNRYVEIRKKHSRYYNIISWPMLLPGEKGLPSIIDNKSVEGDLLRGLWNEK